MPALARSFNEWALRFSAGHEPRSTPSGRASWWRGTSPLRSAPARPRPTSTTTWASGGLAAAANPLNVPISGLPANIVTRGYHLGVMPGNRLRVLTDWTLNAITPAEVTSLDVISAGSVPLDPDTPRA